MLVIQLLQERRLEIDLFKLYQMSHGLLKIDFSMYFNLKNSNSRHILHDCPLLKPTVERLRSGFVL